MAKSKFWSRLIGDYQAAGDLYLQEGELVRAAEMYARGQHHEQAARLFFRAGLPERGLEQLELADAPLAAGDLLVADGQYREAVRYFERGGALWRAAEAALKSNQVPRAAGLFERAGAYERAASCYEKAESFDDALRCWGLEGERLGEEGDAKARQTVDRRRAQLLAGMGRYRESAELLEELGLASKAAEHWMKAGRVEQALESLLRASHASQAAALLDRSEVAVSPELRARVLAAAGRQAEAGEAFLQMGRPAEAVEAFERAAELTRAAEVAESVGDWDRAGALYRRIDRWSDAARCFHRAGQPGRAAEAWRTAGDPRKAAGSYLEANLPLQAAESFQKAGDSESAMRALLAVDPGSDDYEAAVLRLAPMLIGGGDAAGALDRLEILTSGAGLAKDRDYWRARALEQLDRLEDAVEAYAAVVHKHRRHRDAASRLLALRGRLAERRHKLAETQPIGQMQLPDVLAERYEIGKELGRGGMSRVFKAFDRERRERVALKILLSTLIAAAEAEQRLMNEFKICSRLDHPNIVRIYDFDRWRGTMYVTMELLEGMTLADLISDQERLPLERVRGVLLDVLAGLGAAHELQVVHRDLKPANVAVTPDAIKIMDFGIARVEDSDLSLTRTGQVVGSPMYMSPEQIQGQEVDGRSDLYSLGILTFTLLVGHEPFRGSTPTAVSLKHLQDPPPKLTELRPGLDPSWGEFVERLLEKEADRRFASAPAARAVAAELPLLERVAG